MIKLSKEQYDAIMKRAEDPEVMQKPSLDKYLKLQVRKPDGSFCRIMDLEPKLRDYFIGEFFKKTGPLNNELVTKINELQNAINYIKEKAPEGSDALKLLPILEKVLK